MVNSMISNPFVKGWQPIEQDTFVSVRSVSIFGDNQVRRGRICGWHISSGLDDDRRDPFEEPKPRLEYEIKFLKTQTTHWVPAENITGFMKGLPSP